MIPMAGTEQNMTGQTMNQSQPMEMMPGMYGAPTPEITPGVRIIPSQEITYCDDPMRELALSTGALIRPELEKFEEVSGYEKQNKFEVLLQSKMGLKMAFKCIKSYSCCKGLKMKIMHISSPVEIITDICKIFLRGEKSCCGGCLCFCRPSMNIRIEENQKVIGRVREPFTFCGKDYEIYDDIGNLIYQVINYEIRKNNEEVGFINKENIAFGINSPKVETYKINFPLDATPESKILLICSALLMVNF